MVGPGSYNSNPFLNIEASINSSHHIVSCHFQPLTQRLQFGYPIFGLPKGTKDEAFTVVNDAVMFDERFTTLKYKRQQRRTKREADIMQQTEMIDSEHDHGSSGVRSSQVFSNR